MLNKNIAIKNPNALFMKQGDLHPYPFYMGAFYSIAINFF
jgi:hypothetical protein